MAEPCTKILSLTRCGTPMSGEQSSDDEKGWPGKYERFNPLVALDPKN